MAKRQKRTLADKNKEDWVIELITRKLRESFEVQGAVDPVDFEERQLPAWIPLLRFLDLVNDGNRHVDLLIPIRATECLEPVIVNEKGRVESEYSETLAEMRLVCG